MIWPPVTYQIPPMTSANGNSPNRPRRSQSLRLNGSVFAALIRARRSNGGRAGATGGASGLSPRSSGTGLSAGSAIALLLPRIGGLRIGLLRDRLAQVFFDDGELCDHLFYGPALDPGKRRCHQFFPELAQAFDDRACGFGQIKTFGAAVVGIGTALDQTAVAEPVEQPGQRDRLQIEHFGQFGLLQPFKAVEPRQDHPLGVSDPELVAFVVRIGPQHARYVFEDNSKFAIEGAWEHGRAPRMYEA